ncbi:MAG: hypothetical protein JW797_12770 [Bradymonadales bacterium]|nr:hypothetical protein [Bradymonadales bacterium]
MVVCRTAEGGSAALFSIHSDRLGLVKVLASLGSDGLEAVLACLREESARLLQTHKEQLVQNLERSATAVSVEVMPGEEGLRERYRNCLAKDPDAIAPLGSHMGSTGSARAARDVIRLR